MESEGEASPPVITRADAKAAGLKRYFTGKPCRHAHLSERLVSNGVCIACSAPHIARWQITNKARFAAYSKAYYQANRDRELARVMAWRAANRERFDATARAWLDANKEHVAGLRSAWHSANRAKRKVQGKAWRAENQERAKALKKLWLANNVLRTRCYAETRRARKLAVGGIHTPAQIKALAIRQKHKCANCKASIKARFEADHIVALSKGGSNDIRNIQLLCKRCNRSKHAMDPILWAQENGRLL